MSPQSQSPQWFPTNLAPIGGPSLTFDALEKDIEKSMARDFPVTVGIGILCDARFKDGPCIIMSVDDKASYGSDPVVLSTEACGKFHDTLPMAPLAIAISGHISTCDGVVTEFCTQIAHIKEQREARGEQPLLKHEDFRPAIVEARKFEYQDFMNDSLQAYLGITRNEWLKETDREIKRKGLAVARVCMKYFPVQLIIGGFLSTNPKHWILLCAQGALYTETGAQHYATGIGATEALKQLAARKQSEYLSAPRSLLHVAEAMRCAKRKYPQQIGEPADYMILRANKPMMIFKRTSDVLKRWLIDFKNKPSDPLQSEQKYRDEFERELCEYKSVNV